MKRTVCLSVLSLLGFGALGAQNAPEGFWTDPSVASEGKADSRPEFVSYSTREQAETGDPSRSPHYVSLEGKWRVRHSTTASGGERDFYLPSFSAALWQQTELPNTAPVAGASPLEGLVPPQLPAEIPLVQYRAQIEIPYLWLDRDLFLHVEGVGGGYSLYVNGRRIGYANDTRTPAEFPISPAVTDGVNTIAIEVYGFSAGNWMETLIPQTAAGTLGKIYLYSQPKLRIEDFVVETSPDSARVHGNVDFAVVMSNSYRSAEKVTLGYDIYSPAGKLLTYNLVEREIPGESTDTIRCHELLYHVMKSAWTPDAPTLYELMLYTRRDGRIIEYIPLRFGFKDVELRDGELWINGSRASLAAADYDAAPDAAATERELKALKKGGFNTVCVSYPQPAWFYGLCDRVGCYVIDQANVNAGYRTDDPNVGGSVANAPDFLPQFIDRVCAMQGRNKNHTSVVALSLGGHCGNGYNLYKAYQWLKAADSLHLVTYRDAQGQWNSDFDFPATRDGRTYLNSAAAQKQPAAKPKGKASARRR